MTTRNDLGGELMMCIAFTVFISEIIYSVIDGRIRIFGFTGLGVMLAWMSEVSFTSHFPNISPINHQLLLLEPVFLVVVIIPLSLIGSLVGFLFYKLKESFNN